MQWITIDLHPCFITRRTEKAVRIRLPRWLDGVVGSFYVPTGCLKDGESRLVMPENLSIEISYKKADDFGEFGDWKKKVFTPEIIKKCMFEVDGHDPACGDVDFEVKAPVLEPVHTEPLEELLDQ